MLLFLDVIDAFNRERVQYVVAGGLAVVLHGHARLTADIDIVVGLDKQNAAKAVEIVSGLGYIPRAPVNPIKFADKKSRALWIKNKGMTMFSFHKKDNPLIGVDFFIDYPIEFTGLMSRAIVKDLGKIPVRVASIKDLISMKRKAGRIKDLEDVRILEMIRHEKD